jgi:hypothetical protein
MDPKIYILMTMEDGNILGYNQLTGRCGICSKKAFLFSVSEDDLRMVLFPH